MLVNTKKKKVLLFISVCVLIALCCLYGFSDKKYVNIANNEIKSILKAKGIEYNKVSTSFSFEYTYEFDNKKVKFYNIIIELDPKYSTDYKDMLGILTAIDDCSFPVDAYSERNIIFQKYIQCEGISYFVDLDNESVLRMDGDSSWKYSGNGGSQSATTDLSVTQAELLASEFTLDFSSPYGKKLEDAWLEDQSNVEISAMYHYYNAKMYDSIGSPNMACDEMKHISSSYSGIMSQEILRYGLEIFGSISEWDGGTTAKQQNEKTITDSKRAEIKSWINDRYDYYDNLEGKYCGDKYTDTIFNEASERFGFTYEEIYNIWSDLPL